ncbi:hypothetical protein [Haloferula sp. BvORR071]|uniref:hypothetical protein n=1 Tax=Haloferula sp. BvORR071 TaxID=1396141 RepID=UPI000555AA51|nr:hypothetical protein [Haloferula sp. BvORR071]
MDLDEEKLKPVAEAILQIFKVFNMFGFKAGDDLRLGSFMHLFEEEGASKSDVDKALVSLVERKILLPNSEPGVRPGGYVLTTDGEATMRKCLDLDSE